jgi:excisionase family DNA binding protein
MLTVKQVAEKLDLTPGRVHQLITKGVIPATKYSGIWLIKEKNIKGIIWNRKPGPQKN